MSQQSLFDEETPEPKVSTVNSVIESAEHEVSPHEPEAGTIWASPLCHPRFRLHRYIALALMCCMGFGSYFAYDSPASLQGHITQDMNVNTASFAMLYAVYSWPNVILCFFGGYLIDGVFGIRLGAVIFATLILIGQLVVSFGAFSNAFLLMELGRLIFGMGGESLAVAQNTYAVSWFKNKELNTVFGLQLSLSRVGSAVGINVVGPLYDNLSTNGLKGHSLLGLVMLITAGTCLFSLIAAIILGFLDRRAEKILQREVKGTGEVIRLSDIKDFNASFWYLTAICVTYYVCIFPFVSLGTIFFKRKYGFTDTEANACDSIIYTISAFVCPLFGFLIDLTGRNLTWVFVSTVITLLGHSMLAFTYINPWFPMCLMGVGYSVLACSLWPMVSYVIPEHQLGTAYGIMQSVQNLGLAVVPMIAGLIIDSYGYIVLEVFFLSCICVCVICIVLLYVSDEKRGGHLNMTIKQRRELVEKEEEQAAAN
ncbi:Major facilitator superfamily domain-containing protein 1 [Halotydeus destructor]|nr:Major facilitator superfamily domain-containing protein 1 [Halotydeus destructor]